ncbi:hypothetical protein GH714_041870 [Hevea brasiliensis]|uniref:Phytocyanin domain-containing protein n=1 Tax=Hevea brasiliensis TaxID=3981 RepID=A0A6A6MXB3_HEVBR|nr:hypothetical protein GH714_041870 [Hevea brasiliensis]
MTPESTMTGPPRTASKSATPSVQEGFCHGSTEEEYKKCNSSHPSFFSNTGNTVYKLDHSGPFYFVSGVSGHCGGTKIIIKVMAPEEDYPLHGGGKKSAGSRSAVLPLGGSELAACLQLVLSYVASRVFY